MSRKPELPHFTAVNFAPGDKVLIALQNMVDLEQMQTVADRLEAFFPGVTFHVMNGVSAIAVQRA